VIPPAQTEQTNSVEIEQTNAVPTEPAKMEPDFEQRMSLTGERALDQLRRSLTNDAYNMHWGPVKFRAEAKVEGMYTDNVFLSHSPRIDDYVIYPQLNLAAGMPVGELNMLTASVGIGYEWFSQNRELNSDAPLISPGSALQFNILVGDFRIKLHETASYEQTLAFNLQVADQPRVYNFTDVGRFDRFNNLAGLAVDWDLNKVILSVSYDHENFISFTDRFKYMNRASELVGANLNYLLGDRTKAGLEGGWSLNNFTEQTVLDDNWRARGGPFIEVRLPAGMILRTGGGYQMARFDAEGSGSDYDTWYAYCKLSQEFKWFTHSLGAGHVTLPGDNANNLRMTYVRYEISTDAIKNFELGAYFTVNFSEEFGGPYFEKFRQYLTGAHVNYLFHKYVSAGVAYNLFLKASDTPDLGFYENQVTVDLTFRF
jgi:hypothetical protein